MKHIIWIIIFFLPWSGNAQSDRFVAELGYTPDWQFHNELEKQIWPDVLAGEKIELETMILATIPSSSASRLEVYREQLHELYRELESKGFASKSRLAQGKLLQKTLNKSWYKQYEYYVDIERLFKDGIFNCLTGSTVGALVMEHFNIPYRIIENDNIVVVHIGEGASEVKLTTQEGYGYTPDNSIMEKAYVDFLEKLGIVSEQDRRLHNDKQLYNKHYMGHGELSPSELVGLHYMNQASLAFLSTDGDKAITLMEKAQVFFPNSDRIALRLLNQKMTIYANDGWSRAGVVQDLVHTTNMMGHYCKDNNLTIDLFSHSWEQYLEYATLYNNKAQEAENSFAFVRENLTGDSLQARATLILHTKMALGFEKRKEYDEAFPHILAASKLAPDMQIVKLLLLENARFRMMSDASGREENYAAYLEATTHDSTRHELESLKLILDIQHMAQNPTEANMIKVMHMMQTLYLLDLKNPEIRYNYENMMGLYFGEIADAAYLERLTQVQDSLIPLGQGEAFSTLVLVGMLNLARSSFEDNQLSDGQQYLTQFVQGIGTRFEVPDDEKDFLIFTTYWEYCAYYIRKVNYKKARTVLEEARPYMTDDSLIDEKINTILIPLGG